jgi:hypothetical protein
MHVCACVRAYVCVRVYGFVHTNATCTEYLQEVILQGHLHVCMHACMFVCMYVCMYVCIYACMRIYVCLFMYNMIYMCACIQSRDTQHTSLESYICCKVCLYTHKTLTSIVALRPHGSVTLIEVGSLKSGMLPAVLLSPVDCVCMYACMHVCICLYVCMRIRGDRRR